MEHNFKKYLEDKKDTRNTPSEIKGWLHPETKNYVQLSDDSIYHTRDVILHPHKFGITKDHIRQFYVDNNSKYDPDKDIKMFEDFDSMDWSDEVVHGMHGNGWLRVAEKPTLGTYYVGGSSPNTVAHGIKTLIDMGKITKNHKVTAHVYGYQQNGKSFNLSYDEANSIEL